MSSTTSDHLKEGIYDKWYSSVRCLELEGGVQEGDVILRSLLDHLATSSSSFQIFLDTVPNGSGFGNDSGRIWLPSGVAAYAIEESFIETGYFVQVQRHGFGGIPSEVARMSMSRFLVHAMFAVVFHGRFVNRDLDTWDVVQRMTVACSREAQLARLSPDVRERLSLVRSEWKPTEMTPDLPSSPT